MATSKLQKLTGELLRYHFGKEKIRENYRPVWLQNEHGNRLELDFYMERIGVAIEVQGEQHTRFIDFFHTDNNGFENRREWDRIKKATCKKRGIKLFEIHSQQDLNRAIKAISTAVNPESKLPGIHSGDARQHDRNMAVPPPVKIKTIRSELDKALALKQKLISKNVRQGQINVINRDIKRLRRQLQNGKPD